MSHSLQQAPTSPTGRRRPLRSRSASTLVEPRLLAVVASLAAVLLALLAASISIGDFAVPLSEVVPAALGVGDEDAAFVVRTLRLPRALTGALVGAAFGLSGAVFQRLTGNVLASPDIIGITAGASAGAVCVIVLWSGGSLAVTAGALAGGLASAALISVLAWRSGVSGYRLVLIGIGLTAALIAVTHYLLTRAQITDVTRATVWLTGSLNGRGWEHVVPVGAAVALLAPLTLAQGRGLRALQLGDDAARALGLRVDVVRVRVLLAAVLLAAVATASAGPVAFVALAAPPIARRLAATGGLALVPAMLMGACIVVAADLVAEHLLGNLPVGVATALVGAPYLLYLLSRADRFGGDG